jgi:hypothetical protein
MSEKLKPCPFCGSKKTIDVYIYVDGKKEYSTYCTNCKRPTPEWSGDQGKEIIVKKWNPRTESAWEMFRRLFNKYGSYFRREITKVMNTSTLIRFLADRTESEAIAIMQQIEKELEG